MNALETIQFVDKVKKKLSKEYVQEIADAYLFSEYPANTLNAFDNIVADNNLASFSDKKKMGEILSSLLSQHLSSGGNQQSFTSMLSSNPKRISFDANVINNTANKTERTGKFSIAVSGANLFEVLSQILELAKASDYKYDIDIPIMRELDKGIIETISIYFSKKTFEETLEFISSFSPELTALFAPCNKPMMHYSQNIAFDAYDADSKKWGKDQLGEALVRSIDQVISRAVQNAQIQVTIEDANYYNSETNMVASYLYMKDLFAKSNVDFYQAVADELATILPTMNIDTNNILIPKSFRREMYAGGFSKPTSPSGFSAQEVIHARPVQVTFEENKTGVLGEDDIPDMPTGYIQMMNPETPVPELQVATRPEELIKGPEMMLVPEMLERHHLDSDISGLYNAFTNIKNNESQIAAKTMQLNQVWPDLTYADFIAFRQYDKTGEFITDNFIQLWVDTKQQGLTPSVSSNEVYKSKPENLTQPMPEPMVAEVQPMAVPTPEVQQVVDPMAQPIPEPMATEVQPMAVPTPEVQQVVDPMTQPIPEPMVAEVQPMAVPTPEVQQVVVDPMAQPMPEPMVAEVQPMAVPTPEVQQVVADPMAQPVPEMVPLQDQLPVQNSNGIEQVTGMYTPTPVEVQPIEGTQLSQAEVAAMQNIGQQPTLAMNLEKYSFVPNPQLTLSQPVIDVDGSSITLYDYYEKYDVVDKIPENAIITTPNGTYNAYDFIVNNLGVYVVTNGAIGVDEYMELFNATMDNKEKKKGLFGKFLSSKK